MRLIAVLLAVLFAIGALSLGTATAGSMVLAPSRASVGATHPVPAIALAKKKTKHKKKKKKNKSKTVKVVKAAYPLACVARSDATAGDWSGAESQFEAAESAAKHNLSAVSAFASLGIDAGLVALDQAVGNSTTTDLTNYNQDVAAYSSYFRGCAA